MKTFITQRGINGALTIVEDYEDGCATYIPVSWKSVDDFFDWINWLKENPHVSMDEIAVELRRRIA